MKKETGGEDAWYTSDYLLAVADGVGGWNRHGVDPAKFSRKLMTNIEEYYPKKPRHFEEHPKNLGIEIVNNNKEIGSSTLTIAALHPTKEELVVSNIGDSGYAVFREDNGVL